VGGITKRAGVAGRRKHIRSDEMKERGGSWRGRKARDERGGSEVSYCKTDGGGSKGTIAIRRRRWARSQKPYAASNSDMLRA
jgi:hypothetical protein